jgi:hypothetical protein
VVAMALSVVLFEVSRSLESRISTLRGSRNPNRGS